MSEQARRHKEKKFAELNNDLVLDPYKDDLSRVIHSNFIRRLQGKSQLFPTGESDFFRNRLTHSLEVANIGKLIASHLNGKYNQEIPLDVIELAGLCHDAGHPPFGHQGEKILNNIMKNFGGFEGNAQTIRLVTKLEKLISSGRAILGIGKIKGDERHGLNLTAHSLASLLKYDSIIDICNAQSSPKPLKGYYISEVDEVAWLKSTLGVHNQPGPLKTIDCQIMDLADDIAYSTFDLADALHAGFISITDLISGGAPHSTMQKIAKKVTSALQRGEYIEANDNISSVEVLDCIMSLLIKPFEYLKIKKSFSVNLTEPSSYKSLRNFIRKTERLAKVGYYRSYLTRHLIAEFINGIDFTENSECKILSTARFNKGTAMQIECLKNFVYVAVTSRSRVQMADSKAAFVIRTIFASIRKDDGYKLLPDDFADYYTKSRTKEEKMRVICDFVSGMTDRYALEFYGRLVSPRSESIFKPI